MPQTIVLDVNTLNASEIKSRLQIFGFKFNPVENGFWRAKNGKSTITLYKTGKLLIQGDINEPILKNLVEFDIRTQNKVDYKWIGMDEAGKGDYFGPIVVSGVVCDKETEKKLISCGVRDSKSLSDKTISELSEKIKKITPYVILKIQPEKYNTVYQKFKNINKLLTALYSKAISRLIEKNKNIKYILIDKFATESGLSKMFKGYKIDEIEKAEKNAAVAAASILSRHAFVSELENLSMKFDLHLPKGASEEASSAAKKFIRKYGKENLKYVAKLNFKMP